MDRKFFIVWMIVVLLGTSLASCGAAEWPLAPELTGVETLCLEIEKPMTGDDTHWIYNDEDIERILGRLDLELVREGSGCDATLAFTGKGTSSGGSYKSGDTGPSQYCYTGGTVRGAVTLTVGGQEPVRLPVRGSKPRETTTTHCYSIPPYYMLIYSPMLDALEHLFGADFLVRNLMDEKEYIREHVMEGFQELGAEAGPALFDCLSSRDLRAASFCAGYVGGYGGTGIIPRLIEKLRADDIQGRCMAAEALGNLGAEAKESVPELIPLLDDERELRADWPVSRYAVEALQQIAGEDLGDLPEEWQQWWDAQQE